MSQSLQPFSLILKLNKVPDIVVNTFLLTKFYFFLQSEYILSRTLLITESLDNLLPYP